MKFFWSVLIVISQVAAAKAQVWFDLGLNYGIGTGFLMNQDLPDNIPQLGSCASFKLGINPSEDHAIVLEFGHARRSYGMEYANIPDQDPTKEFISFLNFDAFQAAILYRRTTEGSFLEIGPVFSSVFSQNIQNEFDPQLNGEVMNKSGVRGVLGVGGYIIGNEYISLAAGIRLLYDFKDLRSNFGREVNYPMHPYPDNKNIKSLNALDAYINLELNISLGFLVRASCGKRNVIFQF